MRNNLYRCGRAIHAAQDTFVKALIKGVEEPRCNRFLEPQAIFEERVRDELDLLTRYLKGNQECGFLYSGQRIFEIYHSERTIIENIEASCKRLNEDRHIILKNLKPLVSSDDLQAFESAYILLTSGITTLPSKHIRTLFIGDCLMMEIMSFLVSPLSKHGVAIDSFPIHSHDPNKLANIITKLSDNEFDVIFVSPFSHSRLPEIKRLLNPTGLLSRGQLNAEVQNIIDQTRFLLDLLSERFSCPIYIHNALLIPRSSNLIGFAIRTAISWYRRLVAGKRINKWIASYITDKNLFTFHHLFLLDENGLSEKISRYKLSRYLHTSEFQHATVLSQKLAVEYQERILALAQLAGKKLIICDPDEVLWSASKDEKDIIQLQNRQAVLRQLKQHGGIILVLVTNKESSAFDFNELHLKQSDFVATQFGINNKAKAIEIIRNQLNLQTRHMVFINDDESERTLVNMSFPDMLTLDTSDLDIWKRMVLWSETIIGSSDIDRTKLYQEQEQRDNFVEMRLKKVRGENVNSFENLGLIISICEAKKNDLKRVVELINRTNQWNLCGSRTNLDQVQAWHTSDNVQILLASAQDRFGDMGVVGITVITNESDKAEILTFVLSCRVFGYGVETAMLGEIAKRCFIDAHRTSLIGHYLPTNQNQLSRDMYPDHGFQQIGGLFVLKDKNAIPSVPWAEVQVS